jgi:hypothetical protein
MEPIRKDEQLTTADIAGKSPAEKANEREAEAAIENRRAQQPGGPRLVSREQEGKPQASVEERSIQLFPQGELQEMRSRWSAIQTGFVDEPRRTVQEADNLVASAIRQVADRFATERSRLEEQWDRGDNVSTEDLRQALRQYRAFFDRLLSA